jgi:dihydroorotase
MNRILIKDGLIVNRGKITSGDIYIYKGVIERIDPIIDKLSDIELPAYQKWVIPGIIDDQVHFREPGLTHKADIGTESRAAVAGGVTSFMEMPNTNPPALTQALLADKYEIAGRTSLANYSFFMGAGNDNLQEVLLTNPAEVCGIKIFMGSSTGNMLVDNAEVLERIFAESGMLIATHCEDEKRIRERTARFKADFGDNIPFDYHPIIRDEQACYISSSFAVELAKKHGTRLHILHISTEEEIDLFSNDLPLAEKKITSEVCVHHLYFDSHDYETLGSKIKCNPAIKDPRHKPKLFEAMLDNLLDIIATDHAPHTFEEKSGNYFQAPSGLPLVQHSLNIMLDFYQKGLISIEKIVEKMCHAPAICFRIRDRGFLEEGYKADIAIVDPEKVWQVNKENILYKCGWSPLEGKSFIGNVESTIVSGHLAWHLGKLNEEKMGERLRFE